MKIVENRLKFFAVSIVIILAGIVTMIVNGTTGKGIFNFGIEFTGGTSMSVVIGEEFSNDDIIKIVEETTGQKSPQVQKIIGTDSVSIKMQSIDGDTRIKLSENIKQKYKNAVIDSIADVSATVSREMQMTAIKAVMIACVLIYISIRFKDIRAGGSAIIALIHDVCIVMTCYAIFRIPVDNAFIAVLLTILGYSINSTIVIFDRIRENTPKYRKNQTAEKINKSVSQTLGRSINTTLTTLFTIGAIYILGVQSIKDFSLPMIVGIIAGAYSSIFISSSVWYILLPKNEKS